MAPRIAFSQLVAIGAALFVTSTSVSAVRGGFTDDRLVCGSAGKDFDGRIAACTRQISSGHWRGHDLARTYNNRCWARSDRGDFDGAIADCTRAIELDPKLSSPYNNRCRAYRQKGALDDAILAQRVKDEDGRPHKQMPAIYSETRGGRAIYLAGAAGAK
jgi:tetratricopeptide (TPR) repeat protein